MGRLAGHPVANFVCARVMERANQEQTEIVVEEIPPALEGIIENSRTGVLKALLEKTADYKTGEEALNKVGNTISADRTSSHTDCVISSLGPSRCIPDDFRRRYSVSHTMCTISNDSERGSTSRL